MLQQFALTLQQRRQSVFTRADIISLFVLDTKNGFIATIRYFLTSLGIATIILGAIIAYNPAIIAKIHALVPFQAEQGETTIKQAEPLSMLMATPEQISQMDAIDEDSTVIGDENEQLRITNWLAKRYRVAKDATDMLVSASYLTGQEVKLDPLLILSVMAIESGLNPFAESPVGAQGLMQVMSKVHHEKFEDMGGVKAALNPVANIKVGALILKDYVKRGGSVEAGLKLYVGAAEFESDFGYGSRVLTEYRRLKDVAAGKKVPTFFSPNAPAPIKKEAMAETKPVTTGSISKPASNQTAKDQLLSQL
jgi:Transglycosylase SLT domain